METTNSMQYDLTKPVRRLVRLSVRDRQFAAATILIHRATRKHGFTLANARALVLHRFA